MEGKTNKDWRFWVFLVLSILWSIRVFWLLMEDQYFSGFSGSMPLNEVGDFLAGSFSPLAFAWLAYGYWMQNRELRLSNEANKDRITNDLENIKLIKAQLEQDKNILISNEKKNISSSGLQLLIADYKFSEKEIKLEIKNRGAEIKEIVFFEIPSNEKKLELQKENEDDELYLSHFTQEISRLNNNRKKIDEWKKNETKYININLIDELAHLIINDKDIEISEFIFCFDYIDLRQQNRKLEVRITKIKHFKSLNIEPEILSRSDISNTLGKENPWLSKE